MLGTDGRNASTTNPGKAKGFFYHIYYKSLSHCKFQPLPQITSTSKLVVPFVPERNTQRFWLTSESAGTWGENKEATKGGGLIRGANGGDP